MAEQSSIRCSIPTEVDTFGLIDLLRKKRVECNVCWMYECWK